LLLTQLGVFVLHDLEFAAQRTNFVGQRFDFLRQLDQRLALHHLLELLEPARKIVDFLPRRLRARDTGRERQHRCDRERRARPRHAQRFPYTSSTRRFIAIDSSSSPDAAGRSSP